MKSISIKQITFLTLSTLICTLLIEFGTRVFYLYEEKKIEVTKYDPQLGWDFQGQREIPFPLSFNDAGIREPLTKEEIKNKNSTVVFLGNSVVMAQHVLPEVTFVKQVQELLGNRYVINAGFDGYELHREIIKFERALSDLKNIETVIWVPNINDFKTEDSIAGLIEETARLHQQEWNTLTKNFFSDVRKGHLFEKASASFQNFVASFQTRNNDVVFTQKDFYYTQGLLEGAPPETVQFLDSDIRQLKNRLDKRGIKFQVVFLPTRQFSKEKGWKDAKTFHQLAAVLDNYQIPYVQMFDLFHQQSNPENLFIDYVHLNENGHTLVAKQIIEMGIISKHKSGYNSKNYSTTFEAKTTSHHDSSPRHRFF